MAKTNTSGSVLKPKKIAKNVDREAGKHNNRHLFRLDGDISRCKYCNIAVALWDWKTPCKV